MSELRRDPVVGRWVVIAPERALRPSDFKRAVEAPAGLCPFCPGQESLTAPEVLAVRPGGGPANGPGWTLRVTPNSHPALRIEDEPRREGDGLFDRMGGVGAHEVIIETPRHAPGLGELSRAELEQVLWAWGERMRDLARDHRLRSVVVFRNHGARAGATLEHPHSQLIALPLVPPALREELDGAAAHFAVKERCIYCDIVRQERKEGVRLVEENEHTVAFSPWASRVPFETWIVPRRHEANFEEEPRANLGAIAELLRSVLRRLDVALERPAFNLALHSAPLREKGLAHYHWRLEVLPVLRRPGGFEVASGSAINPVPPEEAAAFLRQTQAG